jgi:hypothetical protein
MMETLRAVMDDVVAEPDEGMFAGYSWLIGRSPLAKPQVGAAGLLCGLANSPDGKPLYLMRRWIPSMLELEKNP